MLQICFVLLGANHAGPLTEANRSRIIRITKLFKGETLQPRDNPRFGVRVIVPPGQNSFPGGSLFRAEREGKLLSEQLSYMQIHPRQGAVHNIEEQFGLRRGVPRMVC